LETNIINGLRNQKSTREVEMSMGLTNYQVLKSNTGRLSNLQNRWVVFSRPGQQVPNFEKKQNYLFVTACCLAMYKCGEFHIKLIYTHAWDKPL